MERLSVSAVGFVPGVPALCPVSLRFSCASLLKPLYAWVSDVPAWRSLAAPMLLASDNAATDELVGHAGGLPVVLRRLEERSGVRFVPGPTWGRVEVTAPEVASAYAALWAERSARADAVRSLLRRVPPEQSLGLREGWAALEGVPVSRLGVKCGWDLQNGLLLTHGVVADSAGGAVVLTSLALSAPDGALWAEALEVGGPPGVLPLHLVWATRALASGLAAASAQL